LDPFQVRDELGWDKATHKVGEGGWMSYVRRIVSQAVEELVPIKKAI
jgi:hypothetical protein